MTSKPSQSEIVQYIDHTNVKPEATTKDIKKLCEEAVKHGFHSVCVTPYRVKDARRFLGEFTHLRGERSLTPRRCNYDPEIICVIGFPFGFTTTEEKVNEAKIAAKDGATEIDMVINIGAVKEGDWDYVEKEISEIAQTIKPHGLKVIMEVGFLTRDELYKASQVAKKAGAKFVKTATGYGPRGAEVGDIKIMKKAVGVNFGIKASGAVRDYQTAVKMIQAGATRIGTSSGLDIIGVSSKYNLVSSKGKKELSNE